MRIPKVAWLVGAGGLLLWLVNKSSASSMKLGRMTISIQLKSKIPDAAVYGLAQSVLSARSVCEHFPDVKGSDGMPSLSLDGQTITEGYAAEYTHDILGPIKPEVRLCFLKYLQSINANVVNVTAERVS